MLDRSQEKGSSFLMPSMPITWKRTYWTTDTKIFCCFYDPHMYFNALKLITSFSSLTFFFSRVSFSIEHNAEQFNSGKSIKREGAIHIYNVVHITCDQILRMYLYYNYITIFICIQKSLFSQTFPCNGLAFRMQKNQIWPSAKIFF